MNLISIGRQPRIGRSIAARCADLFFTLGMAGGLVGSLIGSIVLLSYTGSLTSPSNLFELRATHSFLQLFVLLGGFIGGFLLQAARTFLKVQSDPQRIFSITAGCFVTGAVCALPFGASSLSRTGAALAFLSILISLIPLFIEASPPARLRLALPYTVGLSVLSVEAMVFDGSPQSAAIILWCGVAPIIFASAQGFITGTFNVDPITPKKIVLIQSLHFISAVLLVCRLLLSSFDPRITSLFVVSTIASYAIASGLYRVGKKLIHERDPMAIGLVSGFLWAVVGACMLWQPRLVDNTVHAWGLGWAFTLIIVVSSRVVRTVTLNDTVSDGTLALMLAVWQLFVLSRVFFRLLPLPSYFFLFSSTLGMVVICAWLFGLSRAIGTLIVRKRSSRER